MKTKHFILYLSLLTLVLKSFAQTHMALEENWQFRQLGKTDWYPAQVPGCVHTDLLYNGLIPDPFYRTNEKDLQWIDKLDWEYKTQFIVSQSLLDKQHIIMHFNGLDTYADVYLNGEKILEADNMFREWEVDIKPLIQLGENTLGVYFHSPIKKGLALMEASPYPYPAINDQSENGGLGDNKVSVFTRKAGYHYGWDWGPRFVTSGIWRSLFIKAWDVVDIEDIFIKQPKVTSEIAALEAHITLKGDTVSQSKVLVKNAETGTVLTQLNVDSFNTQKEISLPFEINKPKLWWSQGLGDPNLYEFKVEVFVDNKIIAEKSIKTGLRSIKLIREKDKKGESFYFELNGVPVFAKGANYIPNDSFLTRVTKSDYEKVVADAVNANMNMLRVWGGGIYEDDYFYKLCDEQGILVWQDFMFACSMYPGNDAFLESIKAEAIDNVKRLRNHPSIALWCGNNEINAAWRFWGWKERYSKAHQDEISKAYLSIFHEILPVVVADYTDGDHYWPSSPQAGYEPDMHATSETTSGDIHYWGVWHTKHPFEDFNKYVGRFMSEYGFQSFPEFETVKKYALPEDFDIESNVMAAHQRSGIGNLRIKKYMSWDYKVPNDFESFLYMGQVLQARGIKMAIEAHRRAMPYCMGTLFWQINDCWPVASWSSTDYYHNWKAMQYATKKAYNPIMISIWKEKKDIEVYIVTDLLKEQQGTLQLKLLDFEGNVLNKKTVSTTLSPNTSNLVTTFSVKELLKKFDAKSVVLTAEFLIDNDSVAQSHFFFEKPKDILFPETEINYEFIEEAGKKMLNVSSTKLAGQVYFSTTGITSFFSDNYFDVFPGKTYRIEIQSEATIDELKKTLKVIHLQEAMAK